MSERGSFSRHTSHCPTEHAQLSHSHKPSRSPKVFENHLSHRLINGIDKHRARRRDRMITTLFGRINFRVAHRMDHVCDGLCKCSKRRDDALTCHNFTRIDQHSHDNQLTVIFSRYEWHWW